MTTWATDEAEAEVDLDPHLLGFLVCPACRGPVALDPDNAELVCISDPCALAYPVHHGIPVMLIDEARTTVTQPQPSTAPTR